MKAISIRQPWAWLIIHGGKDIENRTWRTTHRGPILIHASSSMTLKEYDDAVNFALHTGKFSHHLFYEMPTYDEMEKLCGGIVGQVDIVDCVDKSQSKWFVGPFGFVVENTNPLPFERCKGRLGIFDVPWLLKCIKCSGATYSGQHEFCEQHSGQCD